MSDQVICRLKQSVDLWPHAATGNWSEDNQIGRDAAEHLLTHIDRTCNPNLLGHTAKAMIQRGEYNGTHVGFFHRVSERVFTDEG